jgi:hypothetical protein
MTTTVTIGGTPATNVRVLSDTTIVATVPPGQGVADVTVTSSGGSATADAAFRYVRGPDLATVSPAVGPEAGGIDVTITGQHFDTGTR